MKRLIKGGGGMVGSELWQTVKGGPYFALGANFIPDQIRYLAREQSRLRYLLLFKILN